MSAAADKPHHQGDEEHPLVRALARALIGEPFTPEQRAELDERMDAVRDGRTKLVRDEDRAARS